MYTVLVRNLANGYHAHANKLFIYLSIYLSFHLSMYLSIYLSIYLALRMAKTVVSRIKRKDLMMKRTLTNLDLPEFGWCVNLTQCCNVLCLRSCMATIFLRWKTKQTSAKWDNVWEFEDILLYWLFPINLYANLRQQKYCQTCAKPIKNNCSLLYSNPGRRKSSLLCFCSQSWYAWDSKTRKQVKYRVESTKIWYIK